MVGSPIVPGSGITVYISDMDLSKGSTDIEPNAQESDSEDSFKAVTRHKERTKKITKKKSVIFKTFTPHDNCPKTIPSRTASQKRYQERISAAQSNRPDPKGKLLLKSNTPIELQKISGNTEIGEPTLHNLAQSSFHPPGLPKEITFYNGLHPSNNVNDFLPDSIILNDDTYIQSTMIMNIMSIITTKHHPLSGSPFHWSMIFKAAEHNLKILEDNNFNIHRCITRYKDSICLPGSEFRSVSTLESILKNHPNWIFLKRTLTKGASMYLCEQIQDNLRANENAELIK
jgi:hypothetical protein